MSKRSEHTFQFNAEAIAAAARAEAEYHEERAKFWEEEQRKAEEEVLANAKVVVRRMPVTMGERIDVSVDYGNPAAYTRLQESFVKLVKHREAAERFRSDQQVYATQDDRMYELDTDDVHHFRLHGGRRED